MRSTRMRTASRSVTQMHLSFSRLGRNFSFFEPPHAHMAKHTASLRACAAFKAITRDRDHKSLLNDSIKAIVCKDSTETGQNWRAGTRRVDGMTRVGRLRA